MRNIMMVIGDFYRHLYKFVNLPNQRLLGSTLATVPAGNLFWKGAARIIFPLESLQV